MNSSLKDKERNERFPLVTIWTLIYNTGPYVIESLKGITNQSYPLDRIQNIIIDDFSTDNSANLVENWINSNNYKCTFIRHKKNWGLCKTLNQVVDLMEGKYCMGSSDDLLFKDTIQTFVNAMEKTDDSIGLAISNMNIINGKNKVISKQYLTPKIITHIKKEGSFFSKLLENYFIPAPSTFYKTNVYKEIGTYDESISVEDYDFHLRVAKKFNYIFIDKILVSYRQHKSNLSNSYNSKENLLMTQYCLLKHVNDKLNQKEVFYLGEAIRKNLEKGYKFNYGIKFRMLMYIDFLMKTKNKLFAISIITKLVIKNTKKTLRKYIK